MQEQFPDAMHIRQRFGCGSSGVDIFEQLHHRGAMPGAAIEGALQLVGDAGAFSGNSFFHSLFFPSSATIATPAALAASRTLSPSTNKHLPASTARQFAPAACITSI